MTTNKPEMIDDALIRPGRIDFNIEFKKPLKETVLKILNFNYNQRYTIEDIEKVGNIIKGRNSHADVINLCRKNVNIDDCIRKLVEN